MAQEDYLKRQIDGVSKLLGKILLNDTGTVEEEDEEEEEDYLVEEEIEGEYFSIQVQLDALIEDGSYNEAENFLFGALEEPVLDEEEEDRREELVQWFYDELANLSDEQLEQGGFSRDELQEGLQDALAMLEK